MNEYLLPELDPAKITLFTIINQRDLARKYSWNWSRHANGFALAYPQNDTQIVEGFGFKVSTISEMERLLGVNSWGFYFCCFKRSLKSERSLGIGEENNDDFSIPGCEMLGWGFHSTRYAPYAEKEAKVMAYRCCKREAEKIIQRTSLSFVELMSEDLRRELEEASPGPELWSGPATPLSARRNMH